MICRFEELTPAQREQLLAFIASFGNPTLTGHPAEMAEVFSGPAFTFGRTHWSLWEGACPVAVLGAVTECWEAKGEIYLAYIYASAGHVHLLDRLLQSALESLTRWHPYRLKVIANTFVPGLPAWAESKGFLPEHRLVEMVQEAQPATVMSTLTWSPVTPELAENYRLVHNEAFLNSLNGRLKDKSAMQGALADFAAQPGLLQLGWLEAEPAVSLSLELKPGLEGVIDSLGVHPRFQGRGLGRQGLHHGIRTLRSVGAQRITLAVTDSNTPAMELYRSAGFQITRTLSISYVRKMKEVLSHDV